MKTDRGPTPSAADGSGGPSAVADFVASLKRRLPAMPAETALPEQLEAATRQVEHADDLSARFTEAATSIGVKVHSATTANWSDVVAGLLREHQAASALIPPAGDGFFEAARVEQLKHRLAACGINAKAAINDETLFTVDAAITGVVAAIAESGTLVCESQPIVARGSSLIPPVHIAVVAATQLLADLYDYFESLRPRPELPANISLISGPSKTADIEGVLVTGVHGPRELHAVLVRQD